jgi:hypothetical protein
MVSPPPPKIAQVNLLQPPPRRRRLPIPGRLTELALVGFVLMIWAGVAIAVAILLGFHF